MSRLMLVGVIAILLALGALTGYAVLGANVPVKGSGLSFTEQRLMDAEKGGLDRHDANVMRAVRSMGADGTAKLDRHDANVMRYIGTNAASGATGPDRHDANVMRYVLANRGNGVVGLDRHDRNVMRYIRTTTK